jgi:DNA-binding transcriptional regulator YdaS (Cro superfamily)
MLMIRPMRFGEWLSKTGTSQDAAAKALGVTQGRISQLVLGGWPGRKLAANIQELTKGDVTPGDFLPPSDASCDRPRASEVAQ